MLGLGQDWDPFWFDKMWFEIVCGKQESKFQGRHKSDKKERERERKQRIRGDGSQQ